MHEFDFSYNIIYFSSAILALFFAVSLDFKRFQSNKLGIYLTFIFLFALTVLVGNRPEEVGTDTVLYNWQYSHVDFMDDREPLFKLFIKILNLFSNDSQLLLLSMALLFYGLLGLFLLKSEKTTNVYLLFFFFFSLFTFKSLGINIIRQGVSLMFILNAYSFFSRKKWLQAGVFAIFALFFHLTSLIPLLLFTVVYFYGKNNILLVIYFLCVFLAFFNIGIVEIFSMFPFLSEFDPRFGYIENRMDAAYRIGFRPNFVIFNTIFLVIALYFRMKLSPAQMSSTKTNYDLLVRYFCISSSLFFLAFQIPYSDRWGIFSWIVIPLLCEPMISAEGNKKYGLILVLLFAGLYSVFAFAMN